jgi:hypothetical protein
MAEPEPKSELLLFFVTSKDLTKCFQRLFPYEGYPFQASDFITTNKGSMIDKISEYTKEYGYIFDLNIVKDDATKDPQMSAKIIAKPGIDSALFEEKDNKKISTNEIVSRQMWENLPDNQKIVANKGLILDKEVAVKEYSKKRAFDSLRIFDLLESNIPFNYTCRFFIIDTEERENNSYFEELKIKEAHRIFIPENWKDFPIIFNEYIFNELYKASTVEKYYTILILPRIATEKTLASSDDYYDKLDATKKRVLDNNIYWGVYENNKDSNDSFISIALNNLTDFEKPTETNRLVDPNGKDDREKGDAPSWYRYFGMGGIRSIRKPTKKTKKTRKPRKKSRKSRKHKKSRKH